MCVSVYLSLWDCRLTYIQTEPLLEVLADLKTTILSQKTNGSFLIKSFLILWKIINFWKLSVGNYLLFHRFINFARYWNPFYIVQCLWPVTIRTSIFRWFVSFNLTNTKYIWSSVKADKQKATKINLCLI